MEMGIEAKFKEAEDEKKKNDLTLEDEDEVEKSKKKEAFVTDPKNMVPPEILNNIAVLRME